jgi:GNAT superfamily N-acetyltransferase
MEWSPEERRREAMRAAIGAHIPRPEARLISREGWCQIVTTDQHEGAGNEVFVSRLSEDEADAVIDRTIAEYAAQGLVFRWAVGPDTTPLDLGARLERRGFLKWSARAMTCDPRALVLAAVTGVNVVEVERVNADAYARVCAAGWKLDPDVLISQMRTLFATPERRHHLFLAYQGDVLAATAGYYAHARSAYLIGGVVLPEMRGRGLYRALVGARLAHAAARGYTLVTTHAREATSAPILERLGFATEYRYTMYASGGPTP